MAELDLSLRPDSDALINLAGLTRDELRAQLADAFGLDAKKARMRANQLWGWIYRFGHCDFSQMTDIAKEMRAGLAEKFVIERPEIVERLVSVDGTRKYLLRLGPGIDVECVYIPDVGRVGALCVSSQVGCTLNCTFCHTGTQKLVRNLTAAEIVNQVMCVKDDLEEWSLADEERKLSNIVFMGMGEPLYNLNNVAKAIDVISDGDGISLSRRRITVSTSGVVPEMEKLGAETSAMLAISLHATNDGLRDELVPINRKYPIAELLDEADAFAHARAALDALLDSVSA